jgi:hypothetical protein
MLKTIGRFLFYLVVFVVIGLLFAKCGSHDGDYDDPFHYARGRR